MPLPERIEIVPPSGPVHAEITVPGSKSITNRALILSVLGNGLTTLCGALWSEDTQVLVQCLQRLGFQVTVESDPDEPCNRTITIQGQSGAIPAGGSADQPVDLFVGNAGTAARFLAALVCLGRGVYRLRGSPRMHERPQAALFEALRQLGYRIDSANDRLPAVIYGGGSRPGLCWIDVSQSSQFASALLLCSKAAGWEVQLVGEDLEEGSFRDLAGNLEPPGSNQARSSSGARDSLLTETGYAALTAKMLQAFPTHGGTFQVEPDASSGSYFWAAGHCELLEYNEKGLRTFDPHTVRVANWPHSGWQMDQSFALFFEKVRFSSPHFQTNSKNVPEAHCLEVAERSREGANHLQHRMDNLRTSGLPEAAVLKHAGRTISRRTDLGDSIMTAIALAPLGAFPTRFTDLGRLRLQECERVAALRTELTKCGAKVIELGDTLTVYPSELHGAEIDTYNDHRMAMCFAILGLKVPGIKINNPACVKKTFPNFFQKLSAAPPGGLGTVILDSRTGRPLGKDELFAE